MPFPVQLEISAMGLPLVCSFIWFRTDIGGIQLKNVCKINFQADGHNSVVWNADYVQPLGQTHPSLWALQNSKNLHLS